MLFGLYKDILADCGVRLTKDTRILDWGCGAGGLVRDGRAAGYDVIGCDFDATGPYLSPIDASNYHLPYSDHSIDVIISASVLEHVMDYDTSLRELRRILKPGGAFLHLFPSRGTPIEPHVFVPGATVIRSRPWLLLWATLGIRNAFQRGMSARAVTETNYRWLREHTNYVGRAELIRYFARHFHEVRFAEDAFLRRRGHPAFLAPLYSTFRNRVVFGRAQLPFAR